MSPWHARLAKISAAAALWSLGGICEHGDSASLATVVGLLRSCRTGGGTARGAPEPSPGLLRVAEEYPKIQRVCIFKPYLSDTWKNPPFKKKKTTGYILKASEKNLAET